MAETKHIRPKRRTVNVQSSTELVSAVKESRSVQSILKKSPTYSSASKPAAQFAKQPQATTSKVDVEAVQDKVIERPRKPRQKKVMAKQSKTEDTPKKDDGKMLSFNSIADLLDASGTELPPQLLEEGAVVEAGLEFSCRDPDEYREEALAEQYRVFLGVDGVGDKENNGDGTFNIFDDDDENGDDDSVDGRQFARDLLEQERSNPHYDGDDYYSDDDYDNDYISNQDEKEICRIPPAKPFLQLWSAFSQWITPEAVLYIGKLRSDGDDETVPQRQADISDIEASRCAGLWAILKMHVSTCWNSLDSKTEDYQMVQKRLIVLLQLLDYRRPTPSISTALTKALGCILLDMVSLSNSSLPDPCEEIGLVEEEYRYLVQRSFLAFDDRQSTEV